MPKIFKNKTFQMALLILGCLFVYDFASAAITKNYVADKGEDETSGFSGFSGGLSRVG